MNTLSLSAQIMEDYDLEFLYNSGALLTRLVGDPPQVTFRTRWRVGGVNT